MVKSKFLYQVSDEDHSFITIWEITENANLVEGTSNRYIDETELKTYIEKYPHCNSVWFSETTEKEAQRLFKEYGLSME